jgi:cupin fold WbuC family metalloprotein
MRQIKYKEEIVAVFHKQDEWKEGLDFLTGNENYIQVGTWWYNKDKMLKAHRHKIYPRVINQTQETLFVISGRLRLDFYDENNNVFLQEELSAGDIGVILNIGHGYYILDDNTRILEIKTGPFTSVETDKEMIQ